MCRTVQAIFQILLCTIQSIVRIFMTILLMIENIIRIVLQTVYNFIALLLQMLSLIPICIVFFLTAKLKCFMCGGGGTPCMGNRGSTCDCLLSAIAIIALFFILRATGHLDQIFNSLGYSKTKT